MVHTVRALGAAALIAVALAACGGGKTTTTTTTTVAQPTTEAQREAAALPQAQVAPIPAGLNCGAVKPVWVNMHTKAYHEPGDPYYGRTKNGQYMCPSAAAQQGYHPAGARHKGTSADETGNGATDNSSASTPGPRHHKKHRSSSNSY